MARALAAIVATALVFLTIVFLLVMTPVFGALDSALYGPDASVDAPEQTEETAGFINTIVLRVIPVLLSAVALIFGYAAVSKRQARRGRL